MKLQPPATIPPIKLKSPSLLYLYDSVTEFLPPTEILYVFLVSYVQATYLLRMNYNQKA